MRSLLGLLVISACAPPPRGTPAPATAPLAMTAPGAWRVYLDFADGVGRPSQIAAGHGAIYLAGPVLRAHPQPGPPRWALCRLDAATLDLQWAVLDEPPGSPMLAHLAVASDHVVAGGVEYDAVTPGEIYIESRDPATGHAQWTRRLVDGPRFHDLGGLTIADDAVLYSGTAGRGAQQPDQYGEARAIAGALAAATGAQLATFPDSNQRGLGIAGDAAGVYRLVGIDSDHDEHYELSAFDRTGTTTAWSQLVPPALSLAVDHGELFTWSTAIEKRSPVTGDLQWRSDALGPFLAVAIDDSGVYASAMKDDGYVLVKLDLATGKPVWSRRTAEYRDSRPTSAIAVDRASIYLLGYEGDRWFVERRGKTDGLQHDARPTRVLAVASAMAR